MAFVNPI